MNPVGRLARINYMKLTVQYAAPPHDRLAPRLSLALLLCLVAATPVLAQSVKHGRMVFESQCMKCHRLDTNFEGPALRNVVGRTAGKAPDFYYSQALESATHVWDVPKLKAWLTNPESVVPGQEMNFHLDSARDREDVVAFLAAQRRTAIRAPASQVCQPGQPATKGCPKPLKVTPP